MLLKSHTHVVRGPHGERTVQPTSAAYGGHNRMSLPLRLDADLISAIEQLPSRRRARRRRRRRRRHACGTVCRRHSPPFKRRFMLHLSDTNACERPPFRHVTVFVMTSWTPLALWVCYRSVHRAIVSATDNNNDIYNKHNHLVRGSIASINSYYTIEFLLHCTQNVKPY